MDNLLNDLKALLYPQLKEVAHHFGMPQEYVADNLSQIEYAMHLIRYAKSQKNGLQSLKKLLASIQGGTVSDEQQTADEPVIQDKMVVNVEGNGNVFSLTGNVQVNK